MHAITVDTIFYPTLGLSTMSSKKGKNKGGIGRQTASMPPDQNAARLATQPPADAPVTLNSDPIGVNAAGSVTIAEQEGSRWRWLNSQWASGIIVGLIYSSAILIWQLLLAHSADDQKRDIQLRVSNEVAANLAPLQTQLNQLTEKVGKIEGRLHIANGTATFTDYLALDASELEPRLQQVAEAIVKAKAGGEVHNLKDIEEFQKRIAGLPLTSPQGIHAASTLINYASFVREKTGVFQDGGQVRKRPCQAFAGNALSAVKLTNFDLVGCMLQIDSGINIDGGRFDRTIIVWRGGPVKLRNVQFVNCLFIFDLADPNRIQKESFQQFARAVLLNETGNAPTFAATVGD